MRTVIFGIALLFAGQASAQPILAREPLTLNPFAVVYVQSGSCGFGKVMKVVGSLRGVQRKRTCVSVISAHAEF
ncbi:hypothetical protein SAMN05216374_0459 [Tardiphaga sp. OK246]|jgi:hypothetical protein|uniref:DUF6719 family protein n=1 Tax=Tardiphaga sp. OK246 TaxID=1855307 RepID=UPI000B686EA6|nr:DUF6719 family protein [Tardiphaga sp. OK246]SNS24223.1 hypothetical protein SAMN05216374_0459 [Tardiphaga sp. OK246]